MHLIGIQTKQRDSRRTNTPTCKIGHSTEHLILARYHTHRHRRTVIKLSVYLDLLRESGGSENKDQ